MTRKKVLEEFLNDKVEQVLPFSQLFFWRGIFYEVIPYKEILKDDTRKASHFVKYVTGKTLYGIREMSDLALSRHYRKEYLEAFSN